MSTRYNLRQTLQRKVGAVAMGYINKPQNIAYKTAQLRILAQEKARAAAVQAARNNPGPMMQPSSLVPEIHCLDTVCATDTVTPGSGTFFTLNLVQTGSADYQRTGNKINLKRLEILGLVSNPITMNTPRMWRIAVIWDKQPTGVTPVFDDIWQAVPSSGIAVPYRIYMPRNPATTDRFYTVMCKDFLLSSYKVNETGTTNLVIGTGGQPFRYFDAIRPLNVTSTYKASSGNTADIATGALYLWVGCEPIIPAVPGSLDTARGSCSFITRLRYTDA